MQANPVIHVHVGLHGEVVKEYHDGTGEILSGEDQWTPITAQELTDFKEANKRVDLPFPSSHRQ